MTNFSGIATLQKMIYEHPRKKKHTINKNTILMILQEVNHLSQSISTKNMKLNKITESILN